MKKEEVIQKLGYRRVILDYHFSDYPIEVLSMANADQIVNSMLEANATSLLMYTKDHWGNVYSEKVAGHRHQNVNFDLFGEVLEKGTKNGLIVYAYYTVCWDEYYARMYPEWCSKDRNGEIICNNGTNRWKSICINSPYRDITYYQIEKLVKSYRFPVLYIDLVNYYYGSNSAPCFCEYCKKMWKADYDEEMPNEFDNINKLKYLKFRNKFVANYLKSLRDIIERIDKNVAITHNFGVNFEYDDFLTKEAEPWGFDYYSGSITAKVFRSFGDGKSNEIVTARFNQFWDFTQKSVNQLIWEGATAFAHNCALLVIDQPNINGMVDKTASNNLKKLFDNLCLLEPYILNSTPYFNIGLYYNLNNQEMKNEKTYYTQYEEEFLGAYKILTEMHIPFDVITNNRLRSDVLRMLKVLIVPNVEYMDLEAIQLIKQFVDNGGTLIYTYRSATRNTSGQEFNSDNKSFGFVDIQIESPYACNFISGFGGMEMPFMRVNNSCVYCNISNQHDILAKTFIPALDVGLDKWVSHNVQPGRETVYPGVIAGESSSGSFLYFTYKFFTEYLHQGLIDYKKAFENLIYDRITPEIHVDAPSCVEVNFMKQGNQLNLIFTNSTVYRPAGDYRNGMGTYHLNMDEVIPIYGIKIKFNKPIEYTIIGSINDDNVILVDANTVTLKRLYIYDVVTFS